MKNTHTFIDFFLKKKRFKNKTINAFVILKAYNQFDCTTNEIYNHVDEVKIQTYNN